MTEEKHYCQCGCNQEIPLTKEHIRRKIYPKYIKGHYKKPCTIEDKVYYCQCGCRKIIPWTKNQKYNRPRYIKGHAKHLTRKPRIPKIILCTCGCEGIIPWRDDFIFECRIPKYIKGHQNKVRTKKQPKITKEEFERNSPYYCRCGCNGTILWKKEYIYVGLPKYIHGHNKNKKMDIEVYKKVIETKRKRGTIYPSIEARKNMSVAQTGKKHTIEQCRKISEGNKGKPAWNKGKHLSPETCKKMSESRSGSKHYKWKGGISKLPYCEKWNYRLKEQIRNEYDRKCFLCGLDEKENIMKNGKMCKLDVHHIDEDKEQGCNGKEWKLVPLRHSCHSKMQKEINNKKIIEKYYYNMLYHLFKLLYG